MRPPAFTRFLALICLWSHIWLNWECPSGWFIHSCSFVTWQLLIFAIRIFPSLRLSASVRFPFEKMIWTFACAGKPKLEFLVWLGSGSALPMHLMHAITGDPPSSTIIGAALICRKLAVLHHSCQLWHHGLHNILSIPPSGHKQLSGPQTSFCFQVCPAHSQWSIWFPLKPSSSHHMA